MFEISKREYDLYLYRAHRCASRAANVVAYFLKRAAFYRSTGRLDWARDALASARLFRTA